MVIPASTITERAFNEGNQLLRRWSENLDPEVAAYYAHLIALGEEARAESKRVAAAARDERIRWVARQCFPGNSAYWVAKELRSRASKLLPGAHPRSEPEVSVAKIIEYHGGKWPSERTVRAALRE